MASIKRIYIDKNTNKKYEPVDFTPSTTTTLIPVRQIGTLTYGYFDGTQKTFTANTSVSGEPIQEVNSTIHIDATSKKIYKKVEYINISHGATLSLPIPFSDALVLKVRERITAHGGASGYIQWNSSTGYRYNDMNTFRCGWKNGSWTNTAITHKEIDEIIYKKSGSTFNGQSVSMATGSTSTTEQVLGINGNSGGVLSKIYSIEAFNNNGIFFNGVPVKEITTGEYGLFDKVNNKFHTHTGTVALTGGNEVIYGKIEIPVKKTYLDATSNRRYERVEYIHSNGAEYIETGITFPNLYAYDYTVTKDSATAQNSFTGCFDSASRKNHCAPFNSSGNIVFYSTSTGTGMSTICTYAANTKYKVSFSKSDGYIRVFNADGTQRGALSNAGYATSSTVPFYVGALSQASGASQFWAGKIYSYNVYDSTGGKVLDLIPVKDIITGEYGMFDLVNNKFCANAGTGAFTGGGSAVKENMVAKVLRSSNGKTATFGV